MSQSETLLELWLSATTRIKNSRIVRSLSFSYNQLLILGILYKSENKQMQHKTICEKLSLLKSQVNRETTNLEESNLIEKVKSPTNKKVVYLSLTEKGNKIYEEYHNIVLSIIDEAIKNVGTEKTETFNTLFEELTNAFLKAYEKHKI